MHDWYVARELGAGHNFLLTASPSQIKDFIDREIRFRTDAYDAERDRRIDADYQRMTEWQDDDRA